MARCVSSQRWKKSDAGGYPEEKGAAGYIQLAAFFLGRKMPVKPAVENARNFF